MARKPTLKIVEPSTASRTGLAAKFGASGAALWNHITSEYDIEDAGGVALLTQVCHMQDRVTQLAAQIAIDGCVIYTKTGPKSHPALRDELGARAFICRNLQRLGINLEAVRPSAGRPGTFG